MRIDQNPLFRKVIVPWYDSESACYIVIFFMVLVFLFGFAGISATRENIAYHEYVWVPVLLVLHIQLIRHKNQPRNNQQDTRGCVDIL